jgi:methylthioribose-1-phosphate isomerase
LIPLPKAVEWHNGNLRLLDQTLLPTVERYRTCICVEDVYDAIRRLQVRGAPAIGVAAAFGMLLGIEPQHSPADVTQLLKQHADRLVSARPTAVNLAWAVNRMLARAQNLLAESAELLLAGLTDEARTIYAEDVACCQRIGEAGLPLVIQYPNLLTHCNAGALAVSELGTALAPIYLAHQQGTAVHVYVDETRPLLQGARLTAYELTRSGVSATLITDNMAASVMGQGKVDAVIVGADRVAANGDIANKIGTLNLAILCHFYKLPFFVACPLSTIDMATATGSAIEIEQRSTDEITHLGDRRIAPEQVNAYNPAFDVTPAGLVSRIITDMGLLSPPYGPAIQALFDGNC